MNKEELRNILDDILLEETLYKKKDRVKEIKYLIYLKSELIRQTKKEIKKLHKELNVLEKNKTLTRKKGE
jgi:hypothetical protein